MLAEDIRARAEELNATGDLAKLRIDELVAIANDWLQLSSTALVTKQALLADGFVATPTEHSEAYRYERLVLGNIVAMVHDSCIEFHISGTSIGDLFEVANMGQLRHICLDESRFPHMAGW